MTRHPADGPLPGQLDLFGAPTPPTPPRPDVGRIGPESNDLDLIHTVAANAIRAGYVIAGPAERVYARDTDHPDTVVRVPRYEDAAVHQLLARRWLTLGAQHRVTCGAVDLVGTAVLVPARTRSRIARWEQLQRPPSWPAPPCTDRSVGGRVVPLDPHRRQR